MREILYSTTVTSQHTIVSVHVSEVVDLEKFT